MTACPSLSRSIYLLTNSRAAVQSWDTETSVHKDAETGFTFSQANVAYSLTAGIIFRIALPTNTSTTSGYDVVIQVISPSALGWVGLAWGGEMVSNPLTVAWPNGNRGVIVSSRRATYVI